MTNLEHILTDESFADIRKEMIFLGMRGHAGIEKDTGQIMLCEALALQGCHNCRFSDSENGCTDAMMKWLNEEYQEPLPFPIGTPIEVEEHFGNVVICYYNGVCDGIHTGVYCKNSIGTNKGFTISIDTARKVGE